MKILLVHNSYVHAGGEERAVSNLEKLLIEHGDDVARYQRSSLEWRDRPAAEKPGQAIETIYSRRSARELTEKILHYRPDVVHVHNVFPVLSPSIYSAAKRLAIPVVQTLHNYRFICANGLLRTPQGEACERCKGGFFAHAVRFGCYGNSRFRTAPLAMSLTIHRLLSTFKNKIDRYIAPSAFVKDKIVSGGFDASRITVIANPIDDAPATPAKRSDLPLVVYVGRLSQEKGLWTLLDAMKEIKDVTLKIIGDGPLKSMLEEKSRTFSNASSIQFLSSATYADVRDWMGRAWMVVVPSESPETFGQVVLEAWSSGTPVVATPMGGLRELIDQQGSDWMFSTGDVQGLRRIIDERTRRFDGLTGQRCRELFEHRNNRDALYVQFLDVYRRAIDKRL